MLPRGQQRTNRIMGDEIRTLTRDRALGAHVPSIIAPYVYAPCLFRPGQRRSPRRTLGSGSGMFTTRGGLSPRRVATRQVPMAARAPSQTYSQQCARVGREVSPSPMTAVAMG